MSAGNSIESMHLEPPAQETSGLWGESSSHLTDGKSSNAGSDAEMSDNEQYNEEQEREEEGEEMEEQDSQEESEEEEKEEMEQLKLTEQEYIDKMEDVLTVDNVDSFLNIYFEPFQSTLIKEGNKRVLDPKMKEKMSRLMKRVIKVKKVVEKFGLSQRHFELLFDVLLVPQKVFYKRDLFPLLIPRSTIPKSFFMRMVSALGYMDKVFTKAGILDWLVTTYSLVEEKEVIENLYYVIFRFLEVYALRNKVCHLLYLMTTQKRVNRNRINRLLELLETDKESVGLRGLLTIYSQYDTTIDIPVNVRVKRRNVFTSPIPELTENIARVQRLWGNDIVPEESRKEFLLQNQIHPIKKIRQSDGSYTIIAQKPPTTFYIDLAAVLQMARNPNDINVSSLIATVEGRDALNHVLALNPDALLFQNTSSVIAYNISGRLASIRDLKEREEALKKQFDELLHFARFHKHHLLGVDLFLLKYIGHWNGYDYEDEVFEMITYINPIGYDDLFKYYLVPLYRLFVVSKISWKAKMIRSFADLLKNWGLVDWKKHLSIKRDSPQVTERIARRFVHLHMDIDYLETMRKMIRYLDKVCVMGLLFEQDDPTIQHASLSFFETVTTILNRLDFPEIVIPSPAFVHRHFFSKSVSSISRICGIINEYKKAFESNEKEDTDWRFETTAEQMTTFNGYMTDICNALWMNKAFVKGDSSKTRFELSDELIESIMGICSEKGKDLNQIGSLVQSPATASLTKRFAESLILDSGGSSVLNQPITPDSYKDLAQEEGITLNYSEFKRQYLDYLFDLGFTGYYDLLYSCMSSLRKAKMAAISAQ
ncbi:hypothetical protein K501DRAFT_329558 [Backusella circina FSU 941]|nr:hypothetical protein K501DRAFT_329558 [Backusella circina FSU 941]